ncbi:AAA family ATPase [Pseudomonas parafulva]|uniref:AAA family ATPase n=1 Tax=Pseudomonas parafulva TaxID=157782 RepID=UPI000541237A|nr:AAA family ATPase [Pseudomonas parafulva]AIZ35269.1 hypothetical protein NJ69_20845 [Pseudomonas parafulva]
MQIRAFRIENIGRFKRLELSLLKANDAPSQALILVGNNGAGKTSILKSLSISLGWFIARLRSEKGSGSLIKDDEINNSENTASIQIEVSDLTTKDVDSHFSWKLVRTRPGFNSPEVSKLSGLVQLAALYREALTTEAPYDLPLIAYYPVERSVIDAPLKPRRNPTFPQLAGYDGFTENTANFSKFFEWFRDREDHENELHAYAKEGNALLEAAHAAKNAVTEDTLLSKSKRTALLEVLNKTISDVNNAVSVKIPKLLSHAQTLPKDRQLTAVRDAIEQFMPGFKNLRVHRKPRLQMLVDKKNETLDILQLSQGEKSLLALVGDIARRLSMLNPTLESPLQGRGIVLIDEVDMHLHPKWQRGIVEQLKITFPNCQFILTTHSPLVISDTQDLKIYSLDDGAVNAVTSQYGQDANSVLLDVMDTPIRNSKIESYFNDLYDAIQDLELKKAKGIIAYLEKNVSPNNTELTKARLMLRKQELRVEKNQ